MKRHAAMYGPARDLNRVRTVHHGSIEPRGATLRFMSNAGNQVSVVLGSYAEVAELAADMLAEIPGARSSDTRTTPSGDSELLQVLVSVIRLWAKRNR